MSDWWTGGESADRALAEELLVVRVAELLNGEIDDRKVVKRDLAERLGIKPAELSQRLSGKRNLTLRSLAGVAHELGYSVEIALRADQKKTGLRPAFKSTHASYRGRQPGVRYTSGGTELRVHAGSGAA